jgi:hypothetical protein
MPRQTVNNAPPSQLGPPRWRIVTARILLAVFCLALLLSVPAVWLRNQIDDTDRYLRTVAPLGSDPAVQAALADRVTTQISTRLDEIVASEGLIDRDRDSFLVAPLVSLLENYVNETVRTFITSDRFPVVWEQLNRTAHPAVSALLTGEGTELVSTANGQITLDLTPLINEIIDRLRERGVDIVDRIQVDPVDTTFVLYESQELVDIQAGVSLVESLAFWLPALALISLVGALAVSVHRRQTLAWAGLTLAATMAVFLMLLAFARWWSVNHLGPGVNREAATAFFETIGRYPREAARLLTLLGLLVAAVVFVTRPGAWLSRERKAAWRSAKTGWASAKARWPGLERAGTWANEHRFALAVGLGVACCLLAIIWDPLSIDWVTAILVLLAAGFAALWLLRARLGPPTLAVSGMVPAVASDGAVSASVTSLAAAGGVRARPEGHSATDDSRAELATVVGELPAEDVRILRRLAVALRDSERVAK